MTRHIGRWAVLAIVLAGIAFSAYNNAALFLSILGTDLTGWLFSIVGLVLFDLGAVGWALFFTHGATGSAQRATALIAALACLVLTLSGAALHLLLTQSLMAVPTWAGMAAMGAIIAALVVNGVGAFAVHLSDPGTLREIKLREVEDEILSEAYRQLAAKGKTIAGQVADRVSTEMRDDAVRLVLGMSAGGDNAPLPVLPAGPVTVPAGEVGAPVYANGTTKRARAEAPKG